MMQATAPALVPATQGAMTTMQIDPFKVLNLALCALADRVLTWVTMIITAGLFAWVLLDPDYIRLAAAILFSLLVFWRVTWIEKAKQPTGEPNA